MEKEHLQELELIIKRSRHGEEGSLTDSAKAVIEINKYLRQKNLLTKPVREVVETNY